MNTVKNLASIIELLRQVLLYTIKRCFSRDFVKYMNDRIKFVDNEFSRYCKHFIVNRRHITIASIYCKFLIEIKCRVDGLIKFVSYRTAIQHFSRYFMTFAKNRKIKKTAQPCMIERFLWSGWQDLNLRPLDPQSSALPSCATLRRLL